MPIFRLFKASVCVALGLSFVLRAVSLEINAPIFNQNSAGPNPIEMAIRKAREAQRLDRLATNEPIRITLSGGNYPLVSPLSLRLAGFGTESRPTIIEAAKGERVILSGGTTISSWRKLREKIPFLPTMARRQCWIADSPREGGHVIELRQLWVNDQKAIRARTPNDPTLARLIEWNRTNYFAGIAASFIAHVHDISHVEMFFHQQWEIAYCRVRSVDLDDSIARLRFREPESTLQFDHPWPQPVMSTNGNGPFFLVNAIEFLDSPGEWFQDLSAGKIYYWPRAGEDMNTANVIAPILENLLQIEGTLEHPIQHITFRNITFAYTAWTQPSQSGHVPLQACMPLLEAYKLPKPHGTDYHRGLENQAWLDRAPAAVTIRNANNITFENCHFEHLGMSGIDALSGTHDCLIQGNTFRDIGGNAIQWGNFAGHGLEAHMPYNPADERELCTHDRIANNYITDIGTEDWGAVAIAAGYVRQISIDHNYITNVPYTGISLGWGWNKATNAMRDNLVLANRILAPCTRMGDTAGIYTLSPQPGTLITSNVIDHITMSPYVADPEHWFYLYTDEGSSYITLRDNWCPAPRFLRNANGPGNLWTNNGPHVSESIKINAGLQPPFDKMSQ